MINDAERASLVARWRKALAERLRPAGLDAENHASELAKFHERLDQLRTLAETTDPVRAGGYEQLWRTMGEELGFVAHDLDRDQLTAADLPASYRDWVGIGLDYADNYLDHAEDLAATHEILGSEAARDTALDSEGTVVWSGDASDLHHRSSTASVAGQADQTCSVDDDPTLTTAADALTDKLGQPQAASDPDNLANDRGERRAVDRERPLGYLEGQADNAAGDDDTESGYRSGEEIFEDCMDQRAALFCGDHDNLDDVEDPVRPELRGKGWLGEPLTELDKAALWRDVGPLDPAPYGDFLAPGDARRNQNHVDEAWALSSDRNADMAAENAAGYAHDTSVETRSNEQTPFHLIAVPTPTEMRQEAARADDNARRLEAGDDMEGAQQWSDYAGWLREDAAATDWAYAADDAAAAVDTSACTAAVSRSAVSADIASRNVSEAAAAKAGNERDAQLAAWSQADRVAQDQAIERNDAAVSDDSPS